MSSKNDSTTETSPKGTVVLNEERCKGCTYCVRFCPTGALEMTDRLNPKGYRLPTLAHPEKCNGCDLCGMYCPDFAIYGKRLKKKQQEEE
ncbi:MAG: 4Fe-4S binding protein [Deltaproteobacteria bacterium]|nr:4Fe-4S binding protein [Deltaproteobacteria bacterium]MBN2674332.1 4Fe-4S binding protein [Deltaproteobacteria bacterium]